MSIATAVALALALAGEGDGERAARVLARDADGFGGAATVTAERPFAVPIPLATRSAVVRRAVPGADGLALRVEGVSDPAAVRVAAVPHDPDRQVLIVDGEPRLVGPATLPVSAREPVAGGGTRDALPELARQDGACAGRGTTLFCRLPDGADDLALLAIGPADARSATRLERRAELSVDAGAHGVDHLFLARVEPLERVVALAPRSAAAERGAVEIRLAPPPRAAGEAWTLLVEVDLAHAALAPSADARPAPGFLVDRAAELGVRAFHFEGPEEQLDIRPTMGPGVAWGDVDLDGDQDLYVVQGAGRPGSDPPRNQLFVHAGARGFDELPHAGGADDDGAGMGALFFDADGNATLDLYVANQGADVLYENRGPRPDDGAGAGAHGDGPRAPLLRDVSAAAGVGGDLWSAGVAASDVDRDGDLDLYVTSYLRFDRASLPPLEELAYRREDPLEMLPYAFPGERNVFLRNESDARGLRFLDATLELGLADAEGRGMQPIFWDYDRDGDDDLYVANDVSPNALWRNEGGGTFKDVSFSSGLDDPRGGMGLAVGDVDADGDEDLFLTNWELEPNALYLNNLLAHASAKRHVATFRDAILPAGIAPFGIGRTGWGVELLDLENDGDLDLFVANGYTSPDYESTGICVGQPNHVFENDGAGKFRDASAAAGPDVVRALPSRAAQACDFDRDGDLDLAVTTNNGPLQLLRNELRPESKGRWLLVRLAGRGGNTYGIGAEVTVEAGGRRWRRSLRAGTSYLGGNPPELHFGLGAAAAVERVIVRWPSGATSEHAALGVDRVITLAEPE